MGDDFVSFDRTFVSFPIMVTVFYQKRRKKKTKKQKLRWRVDGSRWTKINVLKVRNGNGESFYET